MKLSDVKLSRRKFLAASGTTAAALTIAGGLSSLKAVASEHEAEKPSSGERGRKFIPSTCAICVNKCGLIAEVVNGRIKKLNPNPKYLKSRGMLCARGNSGAAIPYDPHRLKKPLLRVGKRGEGKWKEISWDEAFKYVAKKLAELKVKYENRSTVLFASTEGFQEEFFYFLAQSYGSLNTVRHPTLCLASTIQGWMSVYGTYPDADMRNAEFVLMFGANRAEGLVTPDSVDFQRFKPKGQQLIYFDPRFTNTAAKADKWYPIKPGTDLALVLSLINVIIEENLYDKDFVEKYTYGFDKLAEHVKQYTPEWAEKECEVPAADIRWMAREFAKYAPRSVVYPGRRSSWYINDTYFRRACAILTAICGCWDTPGGVVPKSKIKLVKHDDITFPIFDMAEDRADSEAAADVLPDLIVKDDREEGLPKDKVSFLSEKDGSWLVLREAALRGKPYPIKGMMVYKQNPVESVPERPKTLKMMEQMEFICVIDTQMSDTAWYADIVLPESTYLERWDPGHGESGIWPVVAFRQPVIKPLFDTKSMHDIAAGIIDEMLKIKELWDDADPDEVEEFKETVVEDIFHKSTEEFLKHQVSRFPGAFEKLTKEGVFYLSDKPQYGKTRKPGFRFKTRSGKIELYNLKYEAKGLDPLPVYRRPKVEEGKYRFILGRHGFHTHSSTQNIPYLWEIMKENMLWINTREAKKLGITNGDYVIVKSEVGEQKVKAYVTEKIRPDCVCYIHGWGRLSPWLNLVYKKGGSQAAIIKSAVEPISGNAAMHETFVEIRKA
ncbi:molybdopterin oxidoreductase, molybdopterin-binding subunit [Deferribacter desulfuricans SSM1]|uniref:Molybdopterin oxidoreductase, molybdopterin-binding subunit n=1 Tax=Deferribacter desulfuricans (strain DSM 14783 / JCM 11476 / NBRC 101012 / SSM1) TaxID=639282 RepID=D3P8V9_DEFDS|nr:molybdopterin-dependent oxidoreductase [Deferribacter desulfuricans]BAI81149.1 molybdopterin oxidoreductase, molybdopterin-binding subunit [Deferribacter desulfuricans SSM1]